MRLSVFLISFLCLGCSEFATAIEPMQGDDDPITRITGNIENPLVREFISNVVYDDDDYTYTEILDYCNIPTDWDKTYPSPIIVPIDKDLVQRLTVEGVDTLVVLTYKDGQLFRRDVHELGAEIPVYNLIPNQEYYYTVSYIGADGRNYSFGDGYLDVQGRFRAIKVDGMHNFRDLGGYVTLYGKQIKYDKLFRSAEPQRKESPTQGDITLNGINEILNNLRIDVELDFGDAYTESPLQGCLEFVGSIDYKISYYDYALNPISTGYCGDKIKNCFELILDNLRQGKKVLFHCNVGADRTGTLAFLLESLLGVCESDLAKDYEMTSFFQKYTRRRDVDCVPERGCGYPSMITYIKTHFDGGSINEKVENMMLGFGLSHSQIRL